MRRSKEDPRARTDPHRLADHEVAGVEEHLGADPGPGADPATTVDATPDDRVRADEHPGPDRERLGVPERGPGLHPQARPTPSGERVPDDPAHQRVDLAGAPHEAAVQLGQAVGPVGVQEMAREPGFERRILGRALRVDRRRDAAPVRHPTISR